MNNSSSVIDALETDPDVLLAYFYFDFNDPGKQDCRGLVSSLVFQIGTSFDEGIHYLQEQRRIDLPVYEKLLSMLSQLLVLSGHTFVVIDALDECPEPARDTALFRFLEHLRDLQTRDNIDLHVLVVSRQEPDIQARVLQNTTHSLDFSDAVEHIDEIDKYISSQLYSGVSGSYHGWTDDVKEHVRGVLIRKSNGM